MRKMAKKNISHHVVRYEDLVNMFEFAIQKGSYDNVTVSIVFLN
jgi:serine/threonine protein phosphatase PrpC